MAFKKGESGNPSGRRPGTTAGAKLRKSIETKAPAILKTVIDAAIGGDLAACKILLDRIIPVLKAQALPVNVPIGETLPDTGGNIIVATLTGSIPPDIGSQLITALANQGRLVELQELAERLQRIEKTLELKNDPPKKAR